MPDCRRSAKVMSPGAVPIPPELSPTKRSELASSAENCSAPVPLICCDEVALASGQPLHPPVLAIVVPVAVTFTRLIQETFSFGGVGAVGVAGAGVGSLATGVVGVVGVV